MPNEMIELFDYLPIIKVDLENPYEQLEYLLNNYSQHEEIIEKILIK